MYILKRRRQTHVHTDASVLTVLCLHPRQVFAKSFHMVCMCVLVKPTLWGHSYKTRNSKHLFGSDVENGL